MANTSKGILSPEITEKLAMIYVSNIKGIEKLEPVRIAQKFVSAYNQIQDWSQENANISNEKYLNSNTH